MDKIILLLISLNGVSIASDANTSGSAVVVGSNTELQARNKPVIGDINKLIKIGDREKFAVGWLLSSLAQKKGPHFVIREKDGNFIDYGLGLPAEFIDVLDAGNWVFYPKDSGMYMSNNSRAEDVFVLGTKDSKECLPLHFVCQRRLLANSVCDHIYQQLTGPIDK